MVLKWLERAIHLQWVLCEYKYCDFAKPCIGLITWRSLKNGKISKSSAHECEKCVTGHLYWFLAFGLKWRKSTTHTVPNINPHTHHLFRSDPSIYYYVFVQLSIDLAFSSLLSGFLAMHLLACCGEHEGKTLTGQFHWFLWLEAHRGMQSLEYVCVPDIKWLLDVWL